MIDWYFAKLGPVLGLALAAAVGIVFVAGLVSILVGVLDRDETKRRGFQPNGMTAARGDEEKEPPGIDQTE